MNKISIYKIPIYKIPIYKIIIYVVCMILLFTVGLASAGGIDKIYVSNISGNTGDRLVVSVNATNMSDVGSLQLDLQYNKNVIIAENVTAGEAASGEMFTSNIKDKGVTIGIVSVIGIGGNGSIADITFNVIGATGASSPLTISVMSPTDSKSVPISVQSIDNATFTVGNVAIIGTVSPTAGVSPTTTPMIPNPDNGSGGDTGVRDSGRNGEASNGNPSNVGTKPTESQTVTITKEPSVTKVPEEDVVSKETTQKTTETNTNPKSPGLGIVSSITILSLIYIFERREGKKQK